LKETVHVQHIKLHYFRSHVHINPFGIVPGGLEVDYDAAHGRDQKKF
jgi:glutathionyl-hydroquinone reductase